MKKTKLNDRNPFKKIRKLRMNLSLLLTAAVLVATSMMCSSGYITPASLTETAEYTPVETILPTVQFIKPTETATPLPSATATMDPALASPTPVFDTPTPSMTPLPTATQIAADAPPSTYYAQSGDSLSVLATRFNVNPFEIVSPEAIPETGFISPGQMLMIPNRLVTTTPNIALVPDSEVVYSPSSADFDTETFVETIGGYLSDYTAYTNQNGLSNGGEIVEQNALNHSINPRLLISLLEYNSRWVFGQPGSFSEEAYPMGHVDKDEEGLFAQLSWAAKQINIGYYGWRDGTLTDIVFRDGTSLRIAPELNAGTVGMMYYFAQIFNKTQWYGAIDPDIGFIAQHNAIFGDSWARAAAIEPLLPPGIQQPELILPFRVGDVWAYTGGPHGAWSIEGPQAAIDFAPSSVAHGCAPSELWATATAAGIITRLGSGIMVIDLDGDGKEQTGWAFFYLHLLPLSTLDEGDWIEQGQIIGKPSCEGGRATGTHIHIGRKYNGEWILADGALPFVLSGWQVAAGDDPYEGIMTNGSEVVTASPDASFTTRIEREEPDIPDSSG
ncbi:MAG TPA: hypothetical protein VJ965_10605 [Anaerolineales bacterium]|nr:hypothetical protein [Anaerolineales bacterium]